MFFSAQLFSYVLLLGTLFSCNPTQESATEESQLPKVITSDSLSQSVPHSYGGWYCPDNLRGFPPVNLSQWKEVPVVAHRLPTRAETQSQQSLIYVDTVKYPQAHAFPMALPQLAQIWNEQTQQEEDIIIIQAVVIQKDTIVGYRFLDGGNGSARLREVTLVNEHQMPGKKGASFVHFTVPIQSPQDSIWKVLTRRNYADSLATSFDANQQLPHGWRNQTNVNYYYPNHLLPTSAFANKIYGCFYVQNTYQGYTEKFLLVEDRTTNETRLTVVAGPFLNDYLAQEYGLQSWGNRVKELAEGL